MRYLTKILMITVCLIALSGIAAACDACVDCKTIGYWKSPCVWPVQSITIGGITYTKDQAIDIMKNPVKEDKSYTMFNALVVAKLNQISGYSSCRTDNIIAGADNWMVAYPLGTGVEESSEAWQTVFVYHWGCRYSGEGIYKILNDFNNGRI